MRQRSAFYQTAPHFSLPQRQIIVPSTQTDALEEQHARASAKVRRSNSSPWPKQPAFADDDLSRNDVPSQSGKHRTAVALIERPLPALTEDDSWSSDQSDTPSLANLRLIPATRPLPRVTGEQRPWWHAGTTSRLTFHKLLLFGTILFGVLGTTIATAGGGPALNFLVNTFHASSPATAASAVDSIAMHNGKTVAQQVHAIIQADSNAGYDSQDQHDAWWNSVCSAASFTEVAHAWGITKVRLGQVLDRLLAHNPPYITTWGGLMTQDGWPWMAEAYGLHAEVAWNAFTFDQLVQRIQKTGVPIVLGMKGGSQSDPWGHFIVMVGGDSNQAQIVDSSTWRMTSLPRSFFTGPTYGVINDPVWWSGETVILTPA